MWQVNLNEGLKMIEINGEKYRLIGREVRRPSNPFSDFISIACIYGGFDFLDRHSTGLEDCDIVEEYGLIQGKKSKLSSSQRKNIVRCFESRYEKVTCT